MKASIEYHRSHSFRLYRVPLAIFAAVLAFWPAFVLLMILEAKAGLSLLATSVADLFRPIAVVAALAAIEAPMFLEGSIRRKITISVCALFCVSVVYVVTIAFAAEFFRSTD